MVSQLQLIQPTQLDAVMPHVEAMLQRGLDLQGMYGIGDAYDQLKAGEWQMWVTWWVRGEPDAVCITTIKQHAKLRECVIMIVVGTDMQRWVHHIEGIEKWARSYGCSRLKIIGRPGWERMLDGFTKERVVLHKDLSNER